MPSLSLPEIIISSTYTIKIMQPLEVQFTKTEYSKIVLTYPKAISIELNFSNQALGDYFNP